MSAPGLDPMWSLGVYPSNAMKLPFRLSEDDGATLLERLDALVETQRQTNSLLERLIREVASAPVGPETSQSVEPSSASSSERHFTRARRGRKTAGQRPREDAKRSSALHEEIEAVLRQAGHPLRANEIADRIRQRGQYAPPRSSKPLSASNVNARVANPTYRSRLVRRDDGIWLASADPKETA